MMTITATNLLVTLIVIIGIKTCAAHWDGAYMRNPTDGFTKKTRWLSEIPDEVKLLDIALPGTEKSGAFDPSQRPERPSIISSIADLIKVFETLDVESIIGDALTTQALNFKDQLNYGIRVFDIQVYHIKDNFMLTCGYSHLGMGFDTVLDSVQVFLTNNPTETVLINLYESKRIKPLGGYDNKLNGNQVIESYLNNGKLRDFYLRANDTNITLGAARGKFILMTREGKFSPSALKLNTDAVTPSTEVNAIVMDQTYLETNWDLYWQKWIPVKSFLYKTTHSSENKVFINYISGWGGSFPYFVASGHSSPGTSAPRLATGLTTPGWSWQYPDFPRVNCFIGICTIAFEGTNILTRDEIRQINKNDETHQRTVGIILMDFPGENLINTIISNNYRLKKKSNYLPKILTL